MCLPYYSNRWHDFDWRMKNNLTEDSLMNTAAMCTIEYKAQHASSNITHAVIVCKNIALVQTGHYNYHADQLEFGSHQGSFLRHLMFWERSSQRGRRRATLWWSFCSEKLPPGSWASHLSLQYNKFGCFWGKKGGKASQVQNNWTDRGEYRVIVIKLDYMYILIAQTINYMYVK